MSDRFPDPGRDRLGWEIAWATLHLFGWRLVAHDDEKELWWKHDDAAPNGGWGLHRRRQQREETS